MRLSDSAIRERLTNGSIVITPMLEDRAIQPTSLDLRLSPMVQEYRGEKHVLDPEEGYTPHTFSIDTYILPPGGFVLGSTIERVDVPNDLVGIVEGKSSLGRLGLAVHITAGFIDPGFRGNITLELKNVNRFPIRLRRRMSICQLCFETIEGEVLRPYGSPGLGSRYQDSHGTIGARGVRR